MSWLDRLKGKGGGTSEEEAAAQEHPRPSRPGVQRAGSREAAPAPAASKAEDDLDALLNDIVSGLAAGNPPADAPEPAPAAQWRPRVSASEAPAVPPVHTDEAIAERWTQTFRQRGTEEAPPVAAPSAPEPEESTAEEEPEETRSADELMAAALTHATSGDYEAALSLWEPLARKGNARAQNNIGACFVDGLGVEPDLDLARRWLELSAEGGDPVGRRNLATLYFKGQGVGQDYARAADLYRAAAGDGDGPAQDMLSWMLLEGEVMPADPAEARRWALAAAEQGIASSMTRLGMIAHNALGMDRDPVEAVRWWRKGAEAGDADGQAMLGAAYHLGAGIPRDRVAAFAWLLRAHAGHSALADRFFDAVRATLSPEEESAAQRRASIPLGEVP